MVACPECRGDLLVEARDLEKGEIVICPECGSELQVKVTRPLTLELLPEEAEGG